MRKLIAFDDDLVEHVPPSAKHMEVVLHTLDKLRPSRPGSLKKPLLSKGLSGGTVPSSDPTFGIPPVPRAP